MNQPTLHTRNYIQPLERLDTKDTQSIPAPSSGQQSLQIEAKNLTNLPAPALNVGDIVTLSVRQNPENGVGSVALRGLLINAQLPKDLGPGDKIQAQIVQQGAQVIFKLIEKIETPSTSNVQLDTVKQVEQQFREIFNSVSGPQLKLLQSGDLSSSLKGTGFLRGSMERLIANLLQNLPAEEKLFTPQEILRELQKASSGEQVKVLRDLANSIRQFTSTQKKDPELIQLESLEAELSALLLDAAENNLNTAEQIRRLISPSDTPKTGPKASAKQVESVKPFLQALERIITTVPEEQRPSAVSVLMNLRAQISEAAARSGALDGKTGEQLMRLAGQIDKLADAEEALNRLNPILQAIGEPAMVLFPFLFQGLLSHTEVSIRSGKEGMLDEEEGHNKKEQGMANRVKVSAPLPHLGEIGVDVFLRDQQVWVKLSSPSKEVSKFIQSRLPELSKDLKAIGFEQPELMTIVGDNEAMPEWALNLSALGSVIA